MSDEMVDVTKETKLIDREVTGKFYERLSGLASELLEEVEPGSTDTVDEIANLEEMIMACAMLSGSMCAAYCDPGYALHKSIQVIGETINQVHENFGFRSMPMPHEESEVSH